MATLPSVFKADDDRFKSTPQVGLENNSYMKILSRFCLALISATVRTVIGAALNPAVENPQLAWGGLDLNGDSDADFDLFAERSVGLDPFGTEVYEVGFVLRGIHDSKLLRATDSRIPFTMGELVSKSRKIFYGGGGVNWVSLGEFNQKRFSGSEWTYQKSSPGPFTPLLEKSNLLVGCKFSAGDGVHSGWIRLARADQHYLTQYDVVEADWNPQPGEPIAAGLPPVIPLTSDFKSDSRNVASLQESTGLGQGEARPQTRGGGEMERL